MFNRALISVSDKSQLDVLCKGLGELSPHCQLLSTGGTATQLREAGFTPEELSNYTGFPECFAGRVKTLHPKIHGGILYRRGTDESDARKAGILPIDLVVVNLYPFQQTYLSGEGDLTEMIDIGGP
ncbi:MAG TPA: bifunctional phosphoribosylaminoimidazolecarboxamide formyltransferase/IMP cyclohydrolase, partial [Phycisphaerales bacterium]|nr:bifunctional phosphoribosylaminoimidazolecarboxamide formyltransferase/IMP cyclohydrolase [Phycisphaerales bacterium]